LAFILAHTRPKKAQRQNLPAMFSCHAVKHRFSTPRISQSVRKKANSKIADKKSVPVVCGAARRETPFLAIRSNYAAGGVETVIRIFLAREQLSQYRHVKRRTFCVYKLCPTTYTTVQYFIKRKQKI
jgi:hypothetical protein